MNDAIYFKLILIGLCYITELHIGNIMLIITNDNYMVNIMQFHTMYVIMINMIFTVLIELLIIQISI